MQLRTREIVGNMKQTVPARPSIHLAILKIDYLINDYSHYKMLKDVLRYKNQIK